MVPPNGQIAGFSYLGAARTMGGCPDQNSLFRYTDIGVLYAMEQRTVLGTLCGYAGATRFLPKAGDDAATLIQNFEREALTVAHDDQAGQMVSVLPAADAPTARNLCQAFLRSGRFLFY